MQKTQIFDPKKLRICRAHDRLWLKTDGQKVEIASPRRALPLSAPDEWISFVTVDGQELGFIKRVADLDDHSREIVRAKLEEAYRIVKIIKVLAVDREPLSGQISWTVEIENFEDDDEMSSREITFAIAGAEDVQTARYPQIFFTDTDGNRYEVENCEEMDLASRRASERYF